MIKQGKPFEGPCPVLPMKLKEKKVIQGLITFSILIVATISLFGDKGLVQYMALKRQQKALEQEIGLLKQERKEWLNKIHSLKTNRTYIETIAREELGMVHNTEIMIQLQ